MTGHMTSLDWYVEAILGLFLAGFILWALGRWANHYIDRALTAAWDEPFDPGCTCDTCNDTRDYAAHVYDIRSLRETT